MDHGPGADHISGSLGGSRVDDESSLSSDAGQVLIRSTGPCFLYRGGGRRRDGGRVSRVTADRHNRTSHMETWETDVPPPPPPPRAGEQHTHPPPGQHRKQLGRALPDQHGVPIGTETHGGSKGPSRAKPGAWKENQQPPECDTGRDRQEIAASRPLTQTQTSGDKEHDLLTCHYPAGGRGALLAALRHSAPLRKEVKVQLLDPGSRTIQSFTHPKDVVSSCQASLESAAGPQRVPCVSSVLLGEAANTAAVVSAATIAATAPLLKLEK
ncbi:uncharacterized protein LOC130126660 [Lampris incognitus]|uniref:uncharacterized protein LOC130126660 n=1 Tax=Lampris incognitus TaxID=2546036 RepID=UPI0024B5C8B6|nr:uncharacterized protein LOC130126660 [Lampris incognitus]